MSFPARVGIPSGLFYFSFSPFIKSFFGELGADIIYSGETDAKIFEEGRKIAESELCLPIKTYLGHIKTLSRNVDWLLLFSYASVEKNRWICPKIMMANQLFINDFPQFRVLNLPIMLRNAANPVLSLRKLYQNFIGGVFGLDKKKIDFAFRIAIKNQMDYQSKLTELGQTSFKKSKLKIAILGHPYVIWDNYLNLNVLKRLDSWGISYVTTDNLSFSRKREEVKSLALPRSLNWTPCEEIVGSALCFANDKTVDGIIFLSMFGCGFDPISEELMLKKKPYLKILIDEHTSQVNVETKLNAFIDTINWGKS